MPVLSDYSVEYATAMLMNLCLRRDGKLAAASPSLNLLEVLADYLENDNEQVRTYVNGSLYSVLSLPSMKVCSAFAPIFVLVFCVCVLFCAFTPCCC